jgi:hypothetical protein
MPGPIVIEKEPSVPGSIIRFEVGEADDYSRPNGGRDEVHEQTSHERVLPQKVERNDSGNDVGGELRRVDLVKEDFLPQGHGQPADHALDGTASCLCLNSQSDRVIVCRCHANRVDQGGVTVR